MSTIFERLREERERMGLSQSAFAEVGGVQKRAQINYEQGERQPDSCYLAAVAKIGADVQYIVTGEHSPSALSADERELLDKFRAAPLAVKAAAIGALTAGAQPAEKAGGRQAAKTLIVTGSGQRVAGRDFYSKE